MKTPLKVERERRGWTLEYVAKQVGVSGAQVSRIENEGVRATEIPQRISLLFGNAVTLEQICAPEKFAELKPQS